MKKNNIIYKLVNIVFNIVVIIILIYEIILGNYHNLFPCVFSLILFCLPDIAEGKLNVIIPIHLKIAFIVFAFSSEILGEVFKLYVKNSYFDSILHFASGFYLSSIGFSLIYLLNSKIKYNLSKVFTFVFILSFSMTALVFWEFAEFTIDKVFDQDMQKDTVVNKITTSYLKEKLTIKNIDHTVLYDKQNNKLLIIRNGYLDLGIIDTMEDLLSGLFGATLYLILFSLYFSNKGKHSIITSLIITTG